MAVVCFIKRYIQRGKCNNRSTQSVTKTYKEDFKGEGRRQCHGKLSGGDISAESKEDGMELIGIG